LQSFLAENGNFQFSFSSHRYPSVPTQFTNFHWNFKFAIISGRKIEIFSFLLVPINTHQYPHSIPTSTEILSLQSYLAEKWNFSVFLGSHRYPSVPTQYTNFHWNFRFAIISGRKIEIFSFLLVPIDTHQYPHSIPTFTEI